MLSAAALSGMPTGLPLEADSYPPVAQWPPGAAEGVLPIVPPAINPGTWAGQADSVLVLLCSGLPVDQYSLPAGAQNCRQDTMPCMTTQNAVSLRRGAQTGHACPSEEYASEHQPALLTAHEHGCRALASFQGACMSVRATAAALGLETSYVLNTLPELELCLRLRLNHCPLAMPCMPFEGAL